MKNVKNIGACLIMLALLSACGGEPSEKDIAATLSASMEQAAQAAGAQATALGMVPEFHGVTKLGCAKATDANGYACDVEIDVTAPLAGRRKQITSIRMVKADDGWRVVER